MSISRRIALTGLATLLLTACVGGGANFKTEYDPLGTDVTGGWRLAEVRVSVPDSLRVSEAETLLPDADIVWREDPLGDRHAQVATIMKNAITLGAQGLRGSRRVIIDVTVTRFHALTFRAEQSEADWGVHNIRFFARVLDASTGAVLLDTVDIRAELPALSGKAMREARAKGQTQKKMITAHVARTIAGWLGTGPDNRNDFSRQGN